MINEIVFESPLNPLSLGSVGINLLKSFYKKGIKVHYLPIGPIQIDNYKLSPDFVQWLNNSLNNATKSINRNMVSIRNWHLSSSLSFPTNNKYLLTYHECDGATPEEINIVKNTNKTFFCGVYSPKVFSDYGCSNIDSFNLGVDNDSFYKTNKTYFTDGRIQWILAGKMEDRKASLKILKLWADKFGKKQGDSYKPGEQQHFLNLCIFNQFLDPKLQEARIAQVLQGVRYTNIQFFPFLNRESYNALYNASDIDLTGLSLSESFNLPSFQMTSLGKWSIVLNAHGHKSWSTPENSIQISPNGKEKMADGVFFAENGQFNIGNRYTWSEKDVLAAFDTAVQKAKTPNIEGEKLKDIFSYDKTVDYILSKIDADLNGK